MYHGNSASAISCRKNLKAFLEANQNASILLVGEAPGYKGCGRTGIPFTSDDHEITASVIHGILDYKYPDTKILMWNALPFHPHIPGNSSSNRTPTSAELVLGLEILNTFLKTFPSITHFCAIGRVAEKSLRKLLPPDKIHYVRHPAHGGKRQCEENLHAAMHNFGY